MRDERLTDAGLIKLLGMLGPDHAGERDAAALAIVRLRRRTGVTWAELLRPAGRSSCHADRRWLPKCRNRFVFSQEYACAGQSCLSAALSSPPLGA